jgi:hypothetical protein
MPLLLLPLALIALFIVIAIGVPFSIIRRYRAGTARRRARLWMAVVNSFSIGLSTVLYLVTAAVSSIWVRGAFSYSVVGLGAGLVIGIIGLRLTRWEATSQSLHYIPNRWLVLALTVGISVRLAFGFWRMWHAWQASPTDHSWLAESGVAGSLATGAVMLGYYLTYWFGIWMRVRSLERRRSRQVRDGMHPRGSL